MGQINKHLRQLCLVLRNASLVEIGRNFKATFPQEIRDHLEHLDERAVGRTLSKGEVTAAPPELVQAWKSDFINFQGDKLSFGGKLSRRRSRSNYENPGCLP